jgi:hypothetical protein
LILAQQARRLVNLLDDTPTVPGEERAPFTNGEAARQVLDDAETALRGWSASHEPIHTSSAQLGSNAIATAQIPLHSISQTNSLTDQQRVEALERAQEDQASVVSDPPYPVNTEAPPSVEKMDHAAIAS